MIAGVPYAVILALITAVLDFMPVLGVSATMIPVMIYLGLQGNFTGVLILIIGMLPFAQALQQTGGIDLAVQALVGLFGSASPPLILACLFLLTATIGLFISNTATAVLMAPVAIACAQALQASPLPFAMTVCLAASAAFMTPISSPVNTLVLGPGQYRFADFVRLGVPFTLLVMLLCVLLVPWLLPF